MECCKPRTEVYAASNQSIGAQLTLNDVAINFGRRLDTLVTIQLRSNIHRCS